MATIVRRTAKATAEAMKDWHPLDRFLHWTLAVLVFIQFGGGWLAATWRVSPAKLELFMWHKSIGITVLGLAVSRIAWRLARGRPPMAPDMPRLQRVAARTSHVMLYLLPVAMPVSGWVINSAGNFPFRVFRLVTLPPVTAPDEALQHLAESVHFWLFVLFAIVVSAHVAAALYHHLVVRDHVLQAMLPFRRRIP
jgi:cytochrome b561